MTLRTFELLAAIALFTGCGLKRLPKDLLQRLPYESKIELLEAENDLARAIDAVDEARSELARNKDAIRRAKTRLSAAEDEVGDAEDEVSKSVAELAVKEAEARVEFLRARQDVNVETLDIQERDFICAQASFELARVTVARKAKIEGSENLDPQDFERQVKDCQDGVAEMRARMGETEKRVAEVRKEWDATKEALAQKTFDARASPYVE